jgi:biofilm PGA synthesis N-glycosyltransferase PgaC
MTGTDVVLWTPPAARAPRLSPTAKLKQSARVLVSEVSRAVDKIRYRDPAKAVKTGRVLVMIPAHDEQDSIGVTITALKRQTRTPDRIVVIADNCGDNTAGVARQYGATVMETVGNRDKKTGALNQGWEHHHKGFEYIAGVDADTVLEPDALQHLEKELREDRNVGGVMARYTFHQEGGMLVRMQRVEFSDWTDSLLHNKRNTYVLGGQLSLFRASALLKVAEKRMGVPWDTSSQVEDMQLTGDLRGLGYKTTVNPEARAYPGAMHNLKSLWAQRQKWDQGIARLIMTSGLNKWTATLATQVAGLLFNGFMRLMFVVMLTASLSVHKFDWSWYWLIPPALAILLNIRQTMRMPNRTPLDVVSAATLVPVELYLIFRATSMTVATFKVLTGTGSDGWATQKKAESGKSMGFGPKIVGFSLLLIGFVYGVVTAWQHLPGDWQDYTLLTGWRILAVLTALQCLMMVKRILRRHRGMKP